MRFKLFSDTHLEFQDPLDPSVLSDVETGDVILAVGDVHRGNQVMDWLKASFPDNRVFFVPGNHEYYRFNMPEVETHMRSRSDDHVTFLNCDTAEHDGYTFIGASLWGEPDSEDFKTHFNDFYVTWNNGRLLNVSDVTTMFNEHKRYLADELPKHDPDKTIVLTHNGPHPGSHHPDYDPGPGTWFFVKDLSDIIYDNQPKLWVHGHTHHPCDYMVGKTRIVNNPRAYRNESPYESFTMKTIET